MAATTSPRRVPVASLMTTAAAAILLASLIAAVDAAANNGVYDPCADATVQRGDGFTFGVAFAGRDAFFSGDDVQLSPCDSRLGLASRAQAQLALFRPQVDQISLLTVNASSGAAFDPPSSGGYMVAFAGRKYAARSFPPVFVSNSSYTVTAFTLVLDFQQGRLQNLYWKTDGCGKCSGQLADFACVNQSCAIKTTSCRGKGGGQVDCSPGIQLAFSGTDKHDAVLNSWYEVGKLQQYSLFGLFSNVRDSLTSQFSSFF